MMLGLRCIKGLSLVEAVLIKYGLLKSMFISEIEMGIQVKIPNQLLQNFLPYSFRFYDPIIAIGCEGVTFEKKEALKLRQMVAYHIH